MTHHANFADKSRLTINCDKEMYRSVGIDQQRHCGAARKPETRATAPDVARAGTSPGPKAWHKTRSRACKVHASPRQHNIQSLLYIIQCLVMSTARRVWEKWKMKKNEKTRRRVSHVSSVPASIAKNMEFTCEQLGLKVRPREAAAYRLIVTGR